MARNSHEEIVEAALRDGRAVLAMMRSGPFFFSAELSSIDAIVFATLSSTVLTPIDTPIRTYLRSQPGCLDYAERMRSRYFPELSAAPAMALSA
ncbi:glutathione S-transferase C-terminal domain-containing protein [Bradyrhizobium sp. GCM10028915]|uniref:glutathione S-transferase C-terminal domain-containing protein n=1 Tax=Bradyrhizobium sp. GCM10028915 TaxID=3273385 RepID=UPI00361D8463